MLKDQISRGVSIGTESYGMSIKNSPTYKSRDNIYVSWGAGAAGGVQT